MKWHGTMLKCKGRRTVTVLGATTQTLFCSSSSPAWEHVGTRKTHNTPRIKMETPRCQIIPSIIPKHNAPLSRKTLKETIKLDLYPPPCHSGEGSRSACHRTERKRHRVNLNNILTPCLVRLWCIIRAHRLIALDGRAPWERERETTSFLIHEARHDIIFFFKHLFCSSKMKLTHVCERLNATHIWIVYTICFHWAHSCFSLQ